MKELMPREKLLKNGVTSLDNFELLAILLQTGTKNEPILDFCKRIMNELNGLDDLINMSIEDWMQYKGIKTGKASKMVAFLEFARRIYQYEKKDVLLKTASEVFDYIKYDFYGKSHEELIVLYVNVKCKLISKKISKGKINILYVDTNDLVKTALNIKASGVFLIHNHPSGDTTPSLSDIDLTNAVLKSLSFFDIKLLDHLIIGNNNFFSFKGNNIL